MAKTIEELEKELQVLTEAKVPAQMITDKAMELQAAKQAEAATASTPAPTPASQTPPGSTGTSYSGATVAEEVTVDTEKYKEATPTRLTREGMFRSTLLGHRLASMNDGKQAYILMISTENGRVNPPNTTSFYGDLGKGVGIFRNMLDGAGIKNELNEQTGGLKIYWPTEHFNFYCLWSKTDKNNQHIELTNFLPITATVTESA